MRHSLGRKSSTSSQTLFSCCERWQMISDITDIEQLAVVLALPEHRFALQPTQTP
jgi:hypothetical protein